MSRFSDPLQRLLAAYQASQTWLRHHPRARRLLVVVLAAALAMAFGLALRQQWQQVGSYALAMRVPWLALAALLYPLSMLLLMVVWHEMVATLAGFTSWGGNLGAYSLVNLAKSLPGMAFQIAGRLMAYERQGVARGPIVRAMALEAALHPLVGLLCLAAVALARAGLPPLVVGVVGGGLVTGSVAGGRWLAARQGLTISRLLRWSLLYALTWVNGLFFLWAILQAALSPLPLSLLDIWFLWLVGSMVSYAATYFLGGLSFLREVTLTALLGAVIPLPLAVVVVAWTRLIGLVSEVGWSALLLGGLRAWQALRPPAPLSPKRSGRP